MKRQGASGQVARLVNFYRGYKNMRDKSKNDTTDLEVCKRKIFVLLHEFNCVIETDDYHWCWLRDVDTDETTSIEKS